MHRRRDARPIDRLLVGRGEDASLLGTVGTPSPQATAQLWLPPGTSSSLLPGPWTVRTIWTGRATGHR